MNVKILLLIFIPVIFISCSSKEKIIGLKQNLHHDDFEYSVQSVDKAERIGDVETKGLFYIITFQVENKAKRVDHQWDNSIAFLVDEKGKQYENNNKLQIKLKPIKDFGLQDKYITFAGKTESTILVFELPKDSKEVYLKVRGEFLMGDMFDGNQFKNTKIKLF